MHINFVDFSRATNIDILFDIFAEIKGAPTPLQSWTGP